jgi:serine/threonine-protein kinase RsbW
LIEGAAEIGSGDVIAHTHYETYDRFIMADIMGHGLSATASAISFSTMIKMVLSMTKPTDKAGEILTLLSHYQNQNTAFSDLMATVVVVDIHNNGKVVYALAGHPPLLLTRAGSNHLLKAGGPPTGLLAEYIYETHETQLHSSDRLVLYTDGIDPIGLTSAGKLPSWFTQTVRQNHGASIEDYAKQIESDIIEQVGKRPADDWTVLIIEAGSIAHENYLAAA